MRFKKSISPILLSIILLLIFSIPLAMAGWNIIYTVKDNLESGESLGYKPFKLYKDTEYAIVVKKISGNVDFDVFLFNPGDRLVAEGKKSGDSSLLLFKPAITEKGYKIVVKNKKDAGEIRLTLAHK